MFQKLYEDKIGTLTQATGTISLAASRLSIGGQQFVNSSALTLAVGSPTANTLYYIYAVRSAGNTILVKSTNANSVGPATYNSWKLVGAFYSDGLASPAFGSFVNIEGKPETDWIFWLPTLGSGFNASSIGAIYKRCGNSLISKVYFAAGSQASSMASCSLPGVSIHPTAVTIANTTSNPGMKIGDYYAYDGTNPYVMGAMITATGTSTSLVYCGGKVNTSSMLIPANVTNPFYANMKITMDFEVPINEWATVTDLKSL